jgi:hypothetical protein
MNRRDALKGLGLSLGYVIATPTILSMLQSCTSHAEQWTPLFFSNKQGHVLQKLVDLILPKTKDTAGALDVNVPQFIDLFVSKTISDEEKEIYKTGLDAVMEELGILNDEPLALKTEHFESLLSKYLRITRAQRLAYILEEDLVFQTLTTIRDQTVFAYITSKEIGENVLAYDPIPGQQKGCISVEEATGGKAWSL